MTTITPLPLRRSTRLTRVAAVALGAAVLLPGVIAGTATGAHADVVFPATFLDTATTSWAYSDDNTDPSAGAPDRLSWTTDDFDDAAWKSATGSFGAKNGTSTTLGNGFVANTLLTQYIAGTSDDVPTFHFRASFELTSEQLGELLALKGRVVYDDAVQVFVNGTKVAGFVDDRVQAAPDAERNLMYAGASGGDPVSSDFTIAPTALKAGTNTVAVAVYQDKVSSSDVYFDLASLAPVVDAAATATDVSLSVGSDESGRNLTWYTDVDSAQGVQLAKKSAQTGTGFPASAATTIPATGAVTSSGEFNRRAALEGLAENTDYLYRVGSDAAGWSATYAFSTHAFSGDYNFLFFGDPQIGASGNVGNDQAGWADTLGVASQTYPDAELLFSAGDQVNTASSEAEYQAYFAPEELQSIPTVPVNGNHDVGSKAYEQHFTVPNLDPNAGKAANAGSSGGDYWFTYKDVLYTVINTNSNDIASHTAFLEKVVAEQGAAAKWKVLAFHHSIYSVAAHTNDTQIKELRSALPPVISRLGFDLVLQGHDHSYTRSYLIKDGVVANADEQAAAGTVTAKAGEVLYVTANSASGSKYYDITAPDAVFASVMNQEKVRNYSAVDVTDESITVTTMRSQQNGAEKPVNSVVDRVTLKRADVTAPVISGAVDSAVAIDSVFAPLAGVTALDAVDGDLTAAIAVSGTVDTSTVGSYPLEYSVADAAGNTATATRTVRVETGVNSLVTPPVVTGDAKVGGTLTTSIGQWKHAPTATAIQWLRDGSAIAGATAAVYVPVAADAGTALAARVTASRTGYADATATTAAVTIAGPVVVDPTPTPMPTPAPVPVNVGATTPVADGAFVESARGSVVAPATATRGESVTVTVGAQYAGDTVNVWLHSTPVLLASKVVGAAGTVSVAIPADAPLGAHRLAVLAEDGSLIGWTNISVAAAGEQLAFTGADLALPVTIAVLLLLAGVVFLVIRRARRA